MDRPYEDFYYLESLIKEFLARKSLRAAFQVILDQEITGWEVWFQIEFARFLAEHVGEPEWMREMRFEFDYRRERERWYLKPDFLIRKKKWARDRYLALEIKQHPQLGNCVANMIEDLAKVDRIRKSQIDLRSYWALGIFRADTEVEILDTVANKLDEFGLPFHEALTSAGNIGRTGFSFVLLPGMAY